MHTGNRIAWSIILLAGVVVMQGVPIAAAPERVERTRTEVVATIRQAGTSHPDWWGSVPLSYPKTLDLTWKKPPKGSDWDTRKNVGQYLWSVINENPGRWKQGAKFMHHVAEVNKNRADPQTKAWNALGHIYADLLQDYARGAYWWEKGGGQNVVGLADCYWRLGNKEMAVEKLGRVSFDGDRYGSAIRLWADMGEPKRAMALAESSAKRGNPAGAYLSAGNVSRLYGDYDLAIKYYERVLAVPAQGKRDWKFQKDLARSGIETIRVFEMLDLTKIRNGTFEGTSMSFAGNLTVSVIVANSRISAVKVIQNKDKQFYSAIKETTEKIVKQQSLRNIDATTGATVTSDAIVNATAKALAEAR